MCASPLTGHTVRSAAGLTFNVCRTCHVISMDPARLPTPETERAHYLTHENDPAQEGYRQFLARLVTPLMPYLNPTMKVLDYGCGPGPAVWTLLEESGVTCRNYDPIFGPKNVEPPYDAIVCTETAEHFHRPGASFAHMLGLLNQGGILGILTQRWTDLERFSSWGYVRDPTHTTFYHERTFEWMAGAWSLDIIWKNERDAIILRKHA